MQLKTCLLVSLLVVAFASAKLTSDRSRDDALKIATAFTRGFLKAVDAKDAARLEKIIDPGFKYRFEGCWKSYGKDRFVKELLAIADGFEYSVDVQRAYYSRHFIKFDVLYQNSIHQVVINTENGLQLIDVKNLDEC